DTSSSLCSEKESSEKTERDSRLASSSTLDRMQEDNGEVFVTVGVYGPSRAPDYHPKQSWKAVEKYMSSVGGGYAEDVLPRDCRLRKCYAMAASIVGPDNGHSAINGGPSGKRPPGV